MKLKSLRLATIGVGVAATFAWVGTSPAQAATSWSNTWMSMYANNTTGNGSVTDDNTTNGLPVEGQFGNDLGDTQAWQANGGTTSNVLRFHVRSVQGCWKWGGSPWNWTCSGWK